MTAMAATGERSDDVPVVFLVGPPGSGKSALGQRVCADLGLRFADLVDDGRTAVTLQELVAARGADVVALPWAPTRDAPWLDRCRRSGTTVALWAHPLDMQARSGRTEALFTPVKRLSTRGGYVLLLADLSEDDAAEKLKELIEDLRTQEDVPPAERQGLLGWQDDWRHDFDADAKACQVLIDAMARFTMQLEAQGASPRKMAGVYGDLNAAGFLVMSGDAPKGKAVLELFSNGPHEYEYRRKISDSSRSLARFCSTWNAFGAFLRDAGLVDSDGG
jgi:hypothetical protein